MHEYYALGAERDRLAAGVGRLEFLRTTEVVARWLPEPPAVVADVGGGPGRYTFWLADRGYSVRHRDVAPLHIEQVTAEQKPRGWRMSKPVGSTRKIDAAIAAAIACYSALNTTPPEPERSVYAERGILVFGA